MRQNKLKELSFDDLPPSNIEEYIKYESTLEREFIFVYQQMKGLDDLLECNNKEIIMSDIAHTNFSKNYIEGLASIDIYSAISDNIYLLDKLKKVQSEMIKEYGNAI